MIEWIEELISSILAWLLSLVMWVLNFLKDMVLSVFELVLDGVVLVFNSITPPEFLSNGLGVLFGALHPDILYFLSMSGLDVALSIYGAGVSFRLLRKLFTLGQW
jgi:hypothetical protein